MKNKNLQMKWMAVTVLMTLLLGAVGMTKAHPVDVKTANKAAQSFLTSKMGSYPKIDLINFAEKASLSNFYVFGNEHCFVIIAADDCVHPVLGYSTENAFGVEKMPENVYGWLKAYDEDVALAVNSKSEATDDIKEEWNNLLNGQGLTPKTRTNVAPLVRTTWNQNAPYNNLCPVADTTDTSSYHGHTPTGCVATAMAQIMNYWEHPVRGIGLHSYIPNDYPEYGEQYADFGATVYDWDNMKNNYSDGYTEEEANAVATLMYQCGVSLDMNYTPTGSGAASQNTLIALKSYFDYDSTMVFKYKSNLYNGDTIVFYTDEAWIRLLKTELESERPMIYRGAGHAFVCDGYDENDNFHFNWGWGGHNDGFFIMGALCPGSSDFSYFNGALIGCRPNVPSISPPTNISTIVEGRNVGLSWGAVSGAVSYKLYRDGDLVANNLTTTSYTDSNLMYGTYSYYVKSVVADGTMSLRSEISIADVYFPGPMPTNLQATLNNNNVNLSWTTPASEDITLNYGNGNAHWYWPSSITYYGHRYLASEMVLYPGKRVTKIETYISSPGTYTVYIYTRSTIGGKPDQSALAFESNSVQFNSVGWHEIVLDDSVVVSGGNDFWVVIKQQDTDADFPIPSFDLQPYNANACYRGYSSPTELSPISTDYPISWFINVYLTDGTYTYNIYCNGNAVANNLSSNTYTDSYLPDDHYVYYVTTNYPGGESDASNEVEVMIGNPQYSILAIANPSSGGSVSGGGTFGYGQTCTLTATPNTDYIFLNWTEDNNVVSNNATYSFLTESNRNLTANFVSQFCVVSVSSSIGGTVSGAGTYQYGQTCTLTAVPNSGYVFEEWTKDGEMVSTNATFTFVVTENATYTANFTIAPSGVLNGLFSVGDSKQVRFSQGNLQYQASTNTWRFAENQWNYVGGSYYGGNVYRDGVLCNNELISNDYDGWIDLFGWGTSGYDHGAVCYQPWSTSQTNSDYFAYGNYLNSLYDQTGKADWGYNSISNGGSRENRWRALNYWEWNYILNERITYSGIRYAKAEVNGTRGILLLPDDWNVSYYALNNTNDNAASFSSNTITASDWSTLEQHGAVFLVAAGYRDGTTIDSINNRAYYWTSYRTNNEDGSWAVSFGDNFLGLWSDTRHSGHAVRLVSDYSAVTQTTTLSTGWNWFSSNVEITLDDLKAALVEAVPNTNITIKSQTQNTKYQNGRWTGQLTALDMTQMYMISVENDCEISLVGTPVDPSTLTVTINNGANWIAFPFSESMTVTNFFGSFPVNNDQVKSQSQNARYQGNRWAGQLNTLMPGKGYIYNSNTQGTRILTFPVGTK